MLAAMPSLRATTLLEELQRRHPARYPDRMLRSLQRRVAHWRATEGPERELIFRQEHPPGLQALSDFTDIGSSGSPSAASRSPICCIISGSPSAAGSTSRRSAAGRASPRSRRASRRRLAARRGAAHASHRPALGGVPQPLQPGGRGGALCGVLSPLRHGADPQQRRVSHENGAVEAAHGHLKTGLAEALELRGTRDFPDLAAYQAFLQEFIARKNARRRAEVAVELAALLPLPPHRTTDFSSATVTVTRSARSRCATSSTPCPRGSSAAA